MNKDSVCRPAFPRLKEFPRRLARCNPPPGASQGKAAFARPEVWIFIAYCVLTFMLVLFHEPWRDEAQGYVLTRDLSFPDMLRQLRNEFHFALWYVLIYPLSQLGLPIFSVNLLHWLFACGTAYLILENAPFRLLSRAALIFSYPLFFEFSAVARNYTIGLFLLALALSLWKRRPRHPFLVASVLALSFSADIFNCGITGGLCCVILFEDFSRKRFPRKRFFPTMLILAAGALLAFLEIRHPKSGFGESVILSAQTAGIRDIPERLANTWKGVSLFLGLPSGTAAVFLLLFPSLLRGSRRALLLFALNTLFILALFVAGNFNAPRHVCFFIIGGVAACWLAGLERRRTGAVARLTIPAAWCFLFFFALRFTLMSADAFRKEITRDFSHGSYAADFLQRISQEIPVFCGDITYHTPVTARLPGRHFFSLAHGRFATFADWSPVRAVRPEELSEMLVSRLPANIDAAVFIACLHDRPKTLPGNFLPIYISLVTEGSIWGTSLEYYWIYLAVRPEKLESYRKLLERQGR